MKQFILFASLFMLASCGSNKEETSQTASATSSDSKPEASVTYPVPVLYSPTWEAGDQKNVHSILNVLKDWEAGNLESLDNLFADSVSIYLANGDRMNGPHDSIIAALKNFRKMYSEIKTEIHSIIPLRHKDTKEDWVAIWFKEITTTAAGKKDSVELQESWMLNSQGKTELVYQYAATIKPPGK